MSGAELILVNPARRKRRTARRMSALQRKYFGKRRSVSRVRANPKRRRRSYAKVTRARRNPSRRRSSRRSYRVTRARRNPSRARRYASRAYGSAKGFLGGAMGFAKEKLIPGAIGAGGALAIDLAWPYAAPYLPAVMTTGIGAVGTRLALAIGIGKGAEMIGGKKIGSEVLNGAIIVTLYDVIKGYAVSMEPALFGTPAASQCPTAQVTRGGNGNCCSCCGGDCCGGSCNSLGVFVDGLGYQSAGRQVGVFVD
jgi:hypothetical protein